MSFRRRIAAAAVLTAALLAVPATASALTSYEGADQSYDTGNRTGLTVCDNESDKTPVKGVYVTGTGRTGSVKDSDGNNGICSGQGTVGGTIYQHKTCEYRSAWPDTCGNWQRY